MVSTLQTTCNNAATVGINFCHAVKAAYRDRKNKDITHKGNICLHALGVIATVGLALSGGSAIIGAFRFVSVPTARALLSVIAKVVACVFCNEIIKISASQNGIVETTENAILRTKQWFFKNIFNGRSVAQPLFFQGFWERLGVRKIEVKEETALQKALEENTKVHEAIVAGLTAQISELRDQIAGLSTVEQKDIKELEGEVGGVTEALRQQKAEQDRALEEQIAEQKKALEELTAEQKKAFEQQKAEEIQELAPLKQKIAELEKFLEQLSGQQIHQRNNSYEALRGTAEALKHMRFLSQQLVESPRLSVGQQGTEERRANLVEFQRGLEQTTQTVNAAFHYAQAKASEDETDTDTEAKEKGKAEASWNAKKVGTNVIVGIGAGFYLTGCGITAVVKKGFGALRPKPVIPKEGRSLTTKEQTQQEVQTHSQQPQQPQQLVTEGMQTDSTVPAQAQAVTVVALPAEEQTVVAEQTVTEQTAESVVGAPPAEGHAAQAIGEEQPAADGPAEQVGAERQTVVVEQPVAERRAESQESALSSVLKSAGNMISWGKNAAGTAFAAKPQTATSTTPAVNPTARAGSSNRKPRRR